MEEVLRAFISALRFHKLGGNVTCGGGVEADFKETALCGQIVLAGEKQSSRFVVFFSFPHFLITFTPLMEMINLHQQEKAVHRR